MTYYCLNCNDYFEADTLTACPHCGAVGDDIEDCTDLCETMDADEWEPTEEDLEAMYEDYEMRRQIGNACAVIGAQ